MKVNKAHEIEKVAAVTEEVEASFKLIIAGLKNLNDQTSFVSNNHVTLQLFSSGFERIVKILLLLKDKYLTGNYPELQKAKNKFNNYDNGHGIEKMLDDLIKYSKDVEIMQRVPMVREDLNFIENNKSFREFLKIITEFSIRQRYYYIDTIILENSNQTFNPFDNFKKFIYSFGSETDLTQLTHQQEERLVIKGAIVCIEKGVTAISRFFTHGLGDFGKQFYGDFSSFIILNDKDLGKLKYLEKKKVPSNSYKAINPFSLSFLFIRLSSKSKTLYSKNYDNWAFTVDKVKVYFKKPNFYFTKIGQKVFALTGKTSTRFKTPTYFNSEKLKPKAYALYLLDEAKTLNEKQKTT
ncbi:hypothetical protein FHS57_000816 [Runella defluvii]|uniref:Uncharacterized protein n=1 Tax=Runella defluvii TaxID=370973 RepID=A0A7W6ENT3_9BACT|nr:hypothetical protein [Runella defluvii]MBB3836834.1 hypothetical protein [Runella defluvii]